MPAKYPDMRYLAYFQAYTNTYVRRPIWRPATKRRWHTRGWWGSSSVRGPTGMPPDLLDYLSDLARDRYLMVEYGIESTYDETLTRINRGARLRHGRRCRATYGRRSAYLWGHT